MTFKRAAIALLLSTTPLVAADWRDSVKVWKVEPFFGEYVVVPDNSMAFCYKSKWRWLAVREARRLAREHGGDVRVTADTRSQRERRKPMWVTFADGKKGGYVEAASADEAMKIAKEKTGRDAVKAEQIPYPATPIIFQGPGDPKYGPCPPFCFTPEQCKGHGSCPKPYACSE